MNAINAQKLTKPNKGGVFVRLNDGSLVPDGSDEAKAHYEAHEAKQAKAAKAAKHASADHDHTKAAKHASSKHSAHKS